MINPFAPYTREEFIEIARFILKLIAQRSPELSKEAATEIAKNFAWEIVEKAQSITFGESDDIKALIAELDIDLSQITPRNRKVENAQIKKICAMSEDLLEAVVKNRTFLQSELHINQDTLDHLMGGLDQFVSATTDVRKKGLKRGPDSKPEIAEFIETITIVFKEASAQSFAEINKLPIKERRVWKGKYFELLELCIFTGRGVQSKEALRKSADRYLEKNDPVRKLD